MRLHAFSFTELAKRKGCEICVWYSEHIPGTLFKIHIKMCVVQYSSSQYLIFVPYYRAVNLVLSIVLNIVQLCIHTCTAVGSKVESTAVN
jgi:hypothetical protein